MTSRRKQMQELRRLTRLVMLAYQKDIRGKQVSIKELEQAIEQGQELSSILELQGGDLVETTEAIRDAIKAGGQLELFKSFDINSVMATEFLLTKSSALVTLINSQQREALQHILAAGRTLGESPKTIALDIVGRIGASGRREGGIIGLNAPLGKTASNVLYALRSGDPAQMRDYLTYELRNRRLDGIVKKAIAAKKPVTSAEVHKILAAYQSNALRYRGEMIARTEVLESINGGQFLQKKQEQAQLGIEWEKYWIAATDDRTRQDHADMNDVAVGLDEPFVLPDGSEVMYPGDTSLNAPAAQIINCRCTLGYRKKE